MNAEELKELVARAESVQEDTRPPADLLERARRTKRRRRQRVVGGLLGVAAVSVAAVVAVASWPGTLGQSPHAGDPTSPSGQTAPADELHITCTPNGPEVSDTTVAAQASGVVLVVDSTLPPGTYLTYNSADLGPSGGDPIEPTSGPLTYPFPPGELLLGCSTPPGMDRTGVVTVEVVDPSGHWRTTTLADQGCEAGMEPAWINVGATGDSAEQAVDRVLDNFLAKTGRRYTARPAEVGYVDGEIQTWLAFEDGTPALTISVRRTATGYDAGPQSPCY